MLTIVGEALADVTIFFAEELLGNEHKRSTAQATIIAARLLCAPDLELEPVASLKENVDGHSTCFV